mmetsp:Transcript_7501/g.23985  ORF Transcript_7501/g.23985 Transcript_7501/m.23985 type:complete len:269 (-) Transcript_7501:1313-2119(-)
MQIQFMTALSYPQLPRPRTTAWLDTFPRQPGSPRTAKQASWTVAQCSWLASVERVYSAYFGVRTTLVNLSVQCVHDSRCVFGSTLFALSSAISLRVRSIGDAGSSRSTRRKQVPQVNSPSHSASGTASGSCARNAVNSVCSAVLPSTVPAAPGASVGNTMVGPVDDPCGTAAPATASLADIPPAAPCVASPLTAAATPTTSSPPPLTVVVPRVPSAHCLAARKSDTVRSSRPASSHRRIASASSFDTARSCHGSSRLGSPMCESKRPE